MIVILFSLSASAERLRIDLASQDPNPVRAGDVVDITLKIENTYDITKEDIRLEIVPEYPFTLYSSSPFIDVGRVDAREIVYKDFKLKVENDAVDGKNRFKLKLFKGKNYDGVEYDLFVDVERKRLELKPYVVDSDIITSGSSGKFTIEIANVGRQNIESLELELLESEDYKLLSTSNYVYLGDLEFDDTETEDFSVYVKEGTNEVKIPLRLKYEVNDKIYEQNYDLSLNLLTEKEAKKIGLIKTSYKTYIIAFIILVIALIVIYKKYRKK
jgi:hypothetical protein